MAVRFWNLVLIMFFPSEVILIIVIFLKITACYLDVDMISDVIQSTGKPTSVISAVCWPPVKQVRLSSIMSNTSTRFVKPESVANLSCPEHQVLFLADIGCAGVSDYFAMNHKAERFRSPFRWLIVGMEKEQPLNRSELDQLVPASLLDMNIYPDCEVIISLQTSTESFYLYEIYRRSYASPWIVEQYGMWKKGNAFTVARAMLVPVALRRLNLDGAIIPIVYVITNNDSINHLDDYHDGHIDTITKANFPVSNQLVDYLNAGRKYLYTDSWGYNINGTWDGVVGFLDRGDAEIGGTGMFVTKPRVATVGFIGRATKSTILIIFRQPKLSSVANIFILPFCDTVWYSSVALAILLLLTLFSVSFWEWKSQHKTGEQNIEPGILRAKLSDIAVFTIGAVCQQGSTTELKGSLGRVVMFILLLAFMFLYISYSANIVALLQSSSSSIRNLEDLLHSRLTLSVHNTVYNRYYVSTATGPIQKAIYERKVAPPGEKAKYVNLEEGIINMRKGMYALYVEEGVGYKVINKLFLDYEKCGLTEITYVRHGYPWLAVRKNSPYKEMFRIGMRRIHEFGLQDRENIKLYPRKPSCSGSGNSFISVSIIDCYPAFVVFVYGVASSLLMLVIELLFAKKKLVLGRLARKFHREVECIS